jgi:nucleotide-binding universal stress UspA family protein
MFKHILLPTDGSTVAAKAVKSGIALAKDMGARVTAYYAIEPPPTHAYGDGYIGERHLGDELERRARDIAQRSVDEVKSAAQAAGVSCDTAIGEHVHAATGIVDTAAAKKCDAIFMASHGHRGLQSLLLGSVTHKVLAHSKIPVLVFR